jgi:hypothetical protein
MRKWVAGFAMAALMLVVPATAHADPTDTYSDTAFDNGNELGVDSSIPAGPVDPGLAQGVAAGPVCAWVEVVGFTVELPGATFVAPYEEVAGSGLFTRAYRDCEGLIHIQADATPAETAAALWAQTIARIPSPSYELNPPVEWHGTVNVYNWLYAGANVEAFSVSGGFAQNRITIRVEPRALTVDWGDGTVQTCAGRGISYASVTHPTLLRERDPGPAEACTHLYKHHSGHQPDQKYPVSVTIGWEASWSSAGGVGGTFRPYSETQSFGFPVDQIETILGPGR